MQFSVMINSLYMLLFLTTSFSFFSFLIQYIVNGLCKSNTQVIKMAIFYHGQFILHSCPFQRVYISHGGMSMLQVKIKFRSKFTYVDSLFSFSSSPNYSWIRAKRQRKLRINLIYKNFNLNLILTYNIYIPKLYNYHIFNFIILL